MKRALLIIGLVVAVMAIAWTNVHAQTRAPGVGPGGWYCPWNAGAAAKGVIQQAGAVGYTCPWGGYGYSRVEACGKGGHRFHKSCMAYGGKHRGWMAGAPRYHHPVR